MAGLRLKAPESFTGHCEIPLHGGAVFKATLEFAHMGRAELADFIKVQGRSDVETLMAILKGWDASQFDGNAFSREAVEALCENYMGAPMAIYEAWLLQLTQARLGN